MSKNNKKTTNNKNSGERKGAPRNRSRAQRGRDTQLGWSIVEKDELISAVNGSVALASSEYSINPGIAATFPLGSPEASKWTEWKATLCEFYFRRTVSEYAAQGQTGRVVLACDYSALNDAPTTLQAAEALHCAMGMPCTPEIRLRLDPGILNKADPKYIRTAAPPHNADVRLYDGGNLFFVTSGCANATEIGELRVRYRFMVRLPNLDGATVPVAATAQYNRSASAAISSLTVIPFDEEVDNGLNIVNTAGVFTMPAGTYAIQTQVSFAAAATAISGIQFYVDGAALSIPCQSRLYTNAGMNSLSLARTITFTEAQTFSVVSYSASSTITPQADMCQLAFTSV
jgi:hypothetical protein